MVNSSFCLYLSVISSAVGYIDLWRQANSVIPPVTERMLCMGDEWYTFPSHFFVPSNVRLAYVKDSFTGQLPAYFASANGTSAHPPHPFNNVNAMEESRYVDLLSCDYIVALMRRQGKEGPLESIVRAASSPFKPLAATLVLDPATSPALTRAFYVPWRSVQMNKYNDYVLFSRRS